jgi:hypothetical protein
MEGVFLGGSRRIARLNDRIRSKLNELVDRGLWMFVGDANGADRALQQHLADRGYDRVVVYAVTGMLRNNVGHWKVRFVDAPKGARGFDLYSVKDIQMASDASYGFMLWDGESRGTLANVRNLLAHGKPVAVHLRTAHRLISLKSPGDLHKLGIASAELGEQHDLPLGTNAGAAQRGTASDVLEPVYFSRPQPKRRRATSTRGRS